MIILERYVFRRVLGFSFGAFLSLILIIWITQALQRINIVTTTVAAAGNLIWLAMLLIPNLVSGVLPFALLIGVIQALNSLNSDSERAAIAASGASISVLARPILALAAIVSVIMMINAHVVAPAAYRGFHNGMRSLNADIITLFLKEGRFEEVQDNLFLSVSSVRGSVVRGLFLSDRRDPSMELTYLAEEGRIEDKGDSAFLLLYNGQLHRRKAGEAGVSIVQFETYAFDLSDLRPDNSGDWVRSSERSTAELLFPDPNWPEYQRDPNSFTQELNGRLSEWLYAIAFALWALVVAGRPRTNRQQTGQAVVLGLGGAIGLRAMGFIASSFVDHDANFKYLLYAVPLASILSSAWMIRARTDVSELTVVRSTQDGVEKLAHLVGRLPRIGLRSRRGRTASKR
ncbi:LptF/LptG family permease [Consotaella aegiceratis]|uniref:LptF/LptG family permease n=1 Tax=Consotaella aegiceratis TaxID=3097961 RepID=UPI002F423EAB